MQIAATLRRQIATGELPPGSHCPSITALTRDHGHTRATCAKALRLLENEGLVVRYPGLGYHVARGD